MKFIIVPPKKAFKINHIINSQVEFHQYAAKNIGFLYSLGEFVLMSNPDNIFPPNLFAVFAKQDLNPFVAYRSQRRNLLSSFLSDLQFNEYFEMNSQPWKFNSISPDVEGIDGLYYLRHSVEFPSQKTFNSGDFFLASREFWFAVGEYIEGEYNTATDTLFEYQGFTLLPGYAFFFFNFTTLHQYHFTVNLFRGDLKYVWKMAHDFYVFWKVKLFTFSVWQISQICSIWIKISS
jgi:hypothetical protein